MTRERSPFLLSYQKQVQTTWLSLRLYENTDLLIDGEKQGLGLQPIFCQLSSHKNVNTHVIVTGQGRGLSKAGLKNFINEKNSSCEVSIYDLDIKTNNKIGVLELVFQATSHFLNQIQPDVLLYIKDSENYAIRGIDSALLAASSLGVTGISVPIEDAEHLIWLAHLPIEALKHWNTPKVQVQVITQDRPDSLARLVRSLKSSHFFGDEISLTINMDRGADPVTKEYCRTLEWPFGQKNIRHRIVQGGLMAAVVESYYPKDDHDYTVLLEDDVELSPYFYTWTKYGILKYRYGPDRVHSSRMYGISYYGSKINELYPPGRRPFDPAIFLEGTNFPFRTPYLWQVPCSWGAVYFPEVWREFHDYFPARLQDLSGLNLQNITVPETRSNRWKKSWKKFLIELIYLRGYVMLYPNYENFMSFSTNHAEAGTHIHLVEGKPRPNDIFGVPLMEEDVVLSGLPGGRLPNFTDLPTLDLIGNVVPREELIQRGRSLQSEVSLCPPSESDELTFDPKDILCVNEERRQIAMDEIEARKELSKKLHTAVKFIANHTLDSNDEMEVDPERLLNIVLEIYNSSSISPSIVDLPTSTQTSAVEIKILHDDELVTEPQVTQTMELSHVTPKVQK
ncbi:1034_t:CDS:2 [Funneliformis caledonium]|uniref:1034_t:CDS:1 n=1 Tax=Funneliformis caledonium TaxID=1117310 RepID=A0A9N8V990_9GLOM|nr:1034_t:CDS:2 [Funneliformis caledonium]